MYKGSRATVLGAIPDIELVTSLGLRSSVAPRRVDGNRSATRAAATWQAVTREHLVASVQSNGCAIPTISCSILAVEWRCRGIRALR